MLGQVTTNKKIKLFISDIFYKSLNSDMKYGRLEWLWLIVNTLCAS